MRYLVNGTVVDSHNAARSVSQPSAYLASFVRSQVRQPCAVDYGCGKLRYVSPLSETFDHVHVLDSQAQMGRRQRIGSKLTTIPEYVKNHYANVTAHTLESTSWADLQADFVLCANVLSAIPFRNERIEVLRRIRGLCNPSGEVLLVTQYRNSYFLSYRTRPNSMKHEGGYLITCGSRAFYYCCLPGSILSDYCMEAGLNVKRCWTQGQSALVLARPGISGS